MEMNLQRPGWLPSDLGWIFSSVKSPRMDREEERRTTRPPLQRKSLLSASCGRRAFLLSFQMFIFKFKGVYAEIFFKRAAEISEV